MQIPDIGKLTGGAILLAVAIWMAVYLESPTASYLGGAIVAIIGLSSIAQAFLKGKDKE